MFFKKPLTELELSSKKVIELTNEKDTNISNLKQIVDNLENENSRINETLQYNGVMIVKYQTNNKALEKIKEENKKTIAKINELFEGEKN